MTTQVPLFSFGTLMDADVLRIVSGQANAELCLTQAYLAGVVQRAVVLQDFPVLVPDEAAVTEGVLISGLSPLALERILFFEGDEYVLTDIVVRDGDGVDVPARYFKDTAVYEVADTGWSFKRWMTTQKADFLVRTEKFMALFGTMSSSEADEFW